MASQVTNYQCPACTGPLHFVGASGRLECDYCGSTFSVKEIEDFYAKKDEQASEAHHAAQEKEEKPEQSEEDSWDASAAGSQWNVGDGNMRVYNCPSCAAELICDENTAATSCPYCGNPSIVPGQFTGSIKPDFIIPFKLDKEAAVTALKNHYRHKPLLPKTFSDENHINEIQGIYVPFWLFNGDADVSANYICKRSHSHREGDYAVTNTDHYSVYREGNVKFEKIPVDASTKMPDEYMDSIEPYDYNDLVPFSNAYLPGFLADKYDVSAEDCAERADERCRESCVEAINSTVTGYESCMPESMDIRMHRGVVNYALMPVWMLHTKWNGEDYLFSMNGQTGKLTGNLPVSKGRFWAWFAGIFVPVAAILALFFFA